MMRTSKHASERIAAIVRAIRGVGPIAAACLICLTCLQGCASDSSESNASEAGAQTSTVASAQADSVAVSSESLAESASGMDFSYSDRDVDASYDASSATSIALSDGSIQINGTGASVTDVGVTIDSAGTYLLSGELSNGSIEVAAGEQDKVQLVFSGVNIACETAPAVQVASADKCVITLAPGSANALSCGSSFNLEDGADEPNATLYSKADLTLNGEGSLAVDGAYRHAISSKDDLVITGGTYEISAVEDALRGRDCVKVLAADITAVAGGDAIVSNNDEDADRGFVSIDGGSFALTAGDDALQAARYVRIADGTYTIDAACDAFHSDGDMDVLGGTCSLAATDDAFHAEGAVAIQGGTIDVSSCYEGIEGECVYLAAVMFAYTPKTMP